MTDFRARIRRRDTLVGSLVTLASTEVAEILTLVGFDWLWIDMEHAPITEERAQQIIQTTAGRAATVIRVPWNDPIHIKRALDLGCDGVLVPQVRTADEARQAVAAAKYPPAGIRSVGIARAQQYGMTLHDSVLGANERVAVIVQIEHIDAVPHIAEILAVPDIDAVIVGPYDLSASMGRPGEFGNPDVIAVIASVAAACNDRKIAWGAFTPDVESAKARMTQGATLIALATDTMHLWRSARAAVSELRGA
jgi:2-dehydro-3-deoxyglucarate aldolase/4-hydroxy-2-oxoheptanedioate aldolase